MDQNIFIIILIIFLLNSEFFFMIKNIIKYGIYLLLLIYIIKIINPDISDYIKKIINGLLNSDENIIIKTISYIIKFFKKTIDVNKLNTQTDILSTSSTIDVENK